MSFKQFLIGAFGLLVMLLMAAAAIQGGIVMTSQVTAAFLGAE
ncbi:hypothetical protein [Brucella endophytica]|nr:hypothetical protein [Brucella endophytica]